jgi:hypothetical protein
VIDPTNVPAALDQLAGMSWLTTGDRRLLEEILLSWRPDRLAELSFFSNDAIPLSAEGRHVDLYAGHETIRIAGAHPGNPLLMSFHIDSSGRLCPGSNIYFSNPVLLVSMLEPLLECVNGIRREDAVTVPAPPLDIERWFPNYGHVLDEWFTLAAARESSLLDGLLPVYGFESTWDASLLSKFETAAAAIFRGVGTNVTTLGGTLHRCRGTAILRHSTADREFLRFGLPITERVRDVCSNLEHHSTDSGSFGPRVFLTRSTTPNPTDAVVNLDQLAETARQAGFTVVNPEHLRFSQLVIGMSEATSIIATWGSALTICSFAQPGASVLALRAGRYCDEDRTLIWGNLIDEHRLAFAELDADAGFIDPDTFTSALEQHLLVIP